MIKKTNRMSKKEFDLVLASRMSFYGETMSFKVIKDAGVLTPKFAAVVSKKVAPKAVGRNNARRRTYSALRPFLKDAKAGSMGIFFLKKEALLKSHEALVREIGDLLKKSAVL